MKGHPMFPLAEDAEETEDDRDFVVFQVKRRDPRSGEWVFASRNYPAEQILEPGDVGKIYGGGVYEVQARNDRKIIARTMFTLEGRPRPLCPDDAVEPSPITAPTASAAPAQGGSETLALIGLMMQQNAEAMRAQTSITVAMVQAMSAPRAPDTSAASMVQAIAQMGQGQQTALFGLLAEAMRNRSDGSRGDASSAFSEGLDLGTAIAERIAGAGKGGGDDADDTLKELIGGVMAADAHRAEAKAKAAAAEQARAQAAAEQARAQAAAEQARARGEQPS